MSAKIEVEGKKYTVRDNLGYQGGRYVKVVADPQSETGERVAVRIPGSPVWRFRTPEDRIR